MLQEQLRLVKSPQDKKCIVKNYACDQTINEIVRNINNKLNREAIKLVIESILARSGDSLYEMPDVKKLKTKITNEIPRGMKIPAVLLKRSTPQGS